MILHWDELSKTSTSFRSPCGVWEGVIHKLLIGSKQKVLGLCLMQTIWAHYGYVHLKRRTGDAWLKRNVMSTVARNRVGCLVSRSHCCCLTVWLRCFHIAFICKEHFQKPTRDALGWTREKRSVKECGQLQRRSWRGGKKRESIVLLSRSLETFLKVLIAEIGRKKSKKRPQKRTDLTRERISALFFISLGCGFSPFPDSARWPRIAILRIYTETKLRWSGLPK